MDVAVTVALPVDIADFVRQIDDADRRASGMLSSRSHSQANWRPNEGAGWSLVQCLDHMALTTNTYLAAIKSATPKAGHRPLQAGGFLSRLFLKKTEPPVSVKIKAPKKIQPAASIEPGEALARFNAVNDEVRRFAIDTAERDLCGTRFRNPYLPGLNFTMATGLLVIAAHTRRHLWQMEQVLKNPGFPR